MTISPEQLVFLEKKLVYAWLSWAKEQNISVNVRISVDDTELTTSTQKFSITQNCIIVSTRIIPLSCVQAIYDKQGSPLFQASITGAVS